MTHVVAQMALVVKSLPTNAGDIEDLGSIPGAGRSPGGGNGNPLQYPCLENPMDRGAWQATVHGITESDTTERLSTHENFYFQFSKRLLIPSYQFLCSSPKDHFEHHGSEGPLPPVGLRSASRLEPSRCDFASD